jgi:hypothetical protein
MKPTIKLTRSEAINSVSRHASPYQRQVKPCQIVLKRELLNDSVISTMIGAYKKRYTKLTARPSGDGKRRFLADTAENIFDLTAQVKKLKSMEISNSIQEDQCVRSLRTER